MSSCACVARANGVQTTTVDVSATDAIFAVEDEDAAPDASGLDTSSSNCSDTLSLSAVLRRSFFRSLMTSGSCLSRLLPFRDSPAFRSMEEAGVVDQSALAAWVVDRLSFDFWDFGGAGEFSIALCSTRLRLKRGLARGSSRGSIALVVSVADALLEAGACNTVSEYAGFGSSGNVFDFEAVRFSRGSSAASRACPLVAGAGFSNNKAVQPGKVSNVALTDSSFRASWRKSVSVSRKAATMMSSKHWRIFLCAA